MPARSSCSLPQPVRMPRGSRTMALILESWAARLRACQVSRMVGGPGSSKYGSGISTGARSGISPAMRMTSVEPSAMAGLRSPKRMAAKTRTTPASPANTIPQRMPSRNLFMGYLPGDCRRGFGTAFFKFIRPSLPRECDPNGRSRPLSRRHRRRIVPRWPFRCIQCRRAPHRFASIADRLRPG